jgi:hypothetical protein
MHCVPGANPSAAFFFEQNALPFFNKTLPACPLKTYHIITVVQT